METFNWSQNTTLFKEVCFLWLLDIYAKQVIWGASNDNHFFWEKYVIQILSIIKLTHRIIWALQVQDYSPLKNYPEKYVHLTITCLMELYYCLSGLLLSDGALIFYISDNFHIWKYCDTRKPGESTNDAVVVGMKSLL